MDLENWLGNVTSRNSSIEVAAFKIGSLALPLDCEIEMNGWGDEINLFLDMGWNAVLFNGQEVIASLDVCVHIVLCLEERFGLFDSRIELRPGKTFSQLDSPRFNSTLNEPRLDCCNRVLRWCKCQLNLFGISSWS